MATNNTNKTAAEITSKLSPQQIADFREAFSLFDANKDNSISAAEIANVFRSLNQNVTDEQLEDILNEYDIDKNGSIDFEEFLIMMASKVKDTDDQKDLEEQVRHAFKMFDADGNGKIDVNELYNAMNQLGEPVTLEEAQTMLDEADLDKDGFISEAEFAATMFKF